ncbi:hypothetical protein NP233_g10525 [Leucocoprinus birnbaumii]|uniref:Uncharacterized protein n=1 Tax=Leucocoprinus birnbaumii TaxID=56174 RepID=A0AAD5YRS6_9AGAR|nr:hypothetical protein NP233_g10525 [Leucocoprinus birnbaumii]
METSAKLWTGFKRFRVLAFGISTVLAMALSVIFSLFAVREWKFYSGAQKSILVIILAINGFSTILLYLMIIVRFRLWLDGARVISLVVFQSGATVVFTISKPNLPCNNLGTVQTCRTIATVAVFVGWSLAGLLLFYALCLAIMSHVPRPTVLEKPVLNLPEGRPKLGHSSTPSWSTTTSSKTLIAPSETEKKNDGKRLSISSQLDLKSSQSPWIRAPIENSPSRTSSLASHGSIRPEQYGVYRPDTPQTIPSPSASSISNSAYLGTPLSYYSQAFPLPPTPNYYTSCPSPVPYSSPKLRQPLLPNPFMDPLSRSATPASVASFHSDGYPYMPSRVQSPANHVPRTLLSGGWQIPSATHLASPRGFLTTLPGADPIQLPIRGPDLDSHRHYNNSTPFTLQAGGAFKTTGRTRKSMDGMTVMSQSVSIHSSSTDWSNGSLSVPRSPSPHHLPIHMAPPNSPSALVLPAHPRLNPVDLRGPQRFHEIRRLGSSPDLRPAGPPTTGKYASPIVTTKPEAASFLADSGLTGGNRFRPR